jgi:hypothetical protein
LAKRDGRYAPRALPKNKKRNPEKEKPRSKNKKDTAEKKPSAADAALTAWIDRSLVAFG